MGGDSLAQGSQPIGGPHTNSAAVGYGQGYADQLFKHVRDGGGEHLRLVKLGCGGETTASMIGDTGSLCPDDYVTGSQLGDAVEFLDEHPGQMAFITINIGSNDIGECQGDPGCFIPQIATNLPFILDTLRDHAGPDVLIVGMNYYAPDVVQWFDDRIIAFVKAYVAVVRQDAALREQLKDEFVEDPVARIRFPKYLASSTLERDGRTYYFVDEETRREFEKQPAGQ